MYNDENDILKVEYNDPHKYITRNCVVFLLPRRLTRSVMYGSQIIFDSHKWTTLLVRKVKGKPRDFEANVCVSLYSTC